MNRSYSKIRHIQEANLLMEKRLVESKSDNLKPLISEQDVKQGAAGDPYQYKKEGGKYFYAKKAEGTNAKWVEQTKDIGIKAIATKIFGDPAPSKTQTSTKPVDPNIPTKENTPLTTPAPTKSPTNTNTPSPTPAPTKTPTNTNTTIPTNTNTNTNTNTPTTNNQQSIVQWGNIPIVGGTFAADKCNGGNTINDQQVRGFLSDGGDNFWSKSTIDTKNKTYYFYYQEPIKKNSSSGKKYCKITDIKTYDLTGYTDKRDNTKDNTKYFGYLVTSVEIPQTT